MDTLAHGITAPSAVYEIASRRFEIGGRGFAEAIADAHAAHQRPRCMCLGGYDGRGVEMYVARLAGMNGGYIVKRMPDTGSHHAPDCPSYEPPAESSGLGQVSGSAIIEDPATGETTLKLDFSMSKISGRTAMPTAGGDSDSVASIGTKLSLRGLLAVVQGSDGHAVTLHRTYLRDGRKALGTQSRKVLSSGINGAAVRLFEAGDELALAEGIETALAVHLSTGKPVWAALSCGNLEKLWIPDPVARVCIYADNDADAGFDGQASAYALAQRLKRDGRKLGGAKPDLPDRPTREVQVFVPKQDGTDWADIWLARLANTGRAA